MPHTEFPALPACALCGGVSPLRRSHLLPNFLFKSLRSTEGTFFAASRPKKPLQAGPVAQMLCDICETLLSRWEDQAKRTFYPEERQAKLPIKYGPWLQLFATSISWRALTFLKYSTKKPYFVLSDVADRLLPMLSKDSHEDAEARRILWGNALLTELPATNQLDQHLLFLNGRNFPNEHYGVVGFTVCQTDTITAVFCQLGPLCILGVIRDTRPNDWKNTRIQTLGGKFHVVKQVIPQGFEKWLENYFNNIAAIED